MKTFNSSRLLVVLLCALSWSATFAQQEIEVKADKDGKKTVVIIKKTMDDDGNVITEKVVKEMDGEEDFSIESDDQFIHMDGDVDVRVNETEDGKHTVIKIVRDGAEQIIEWNGDDDMPEDIQKELAEKNIHIFHPEGYQKIAQIARASSGNKACLGVQIGHKVTVENINGEETEEEEGFSELGVPILGIIDDSGAAAAGLLADDIITAINGNDVQLLEDVTGALADLEPGANVTVDYLRNNTLAQVTATLKACSNQFFIEEIEEEIEIDEENNPDGSSRVIIKKRKGAPNEIIEWNGEDLMEEVPAEELERSLNVERIDIFPNPTDGKFTLQFEAPAVATTIRMVDMSGKEVYAETLNTFDGIYNNTLDLSKTGNGVLILSIQQGDKVFSEKVIVQ